MSHWQGQHYANKFEEKFVDQGIFQNSKLACSGDIFKKLTREKCANVIKMQHECDRF